MSRFSLLRFSWLLPACILLSACAEPKEAAYRSFSSAFSCPREQMRVLPIQGVTPTELWQRANPELQPPADIRNDPARLAIWRKARANSNEGVLRGLKHYELFHVSGCGHEVDLACYCPPHTGGSVTRGGGTTRQDHCSCNAPSAPIAINER